MSPTARRSCVTLALPGGKSQLISADEAELLLANGQADKIPGLSTIKLRVVRPRGDAREWRKSASIDPVTHARTMVMQLVPLGHSRHHQSITPTRPRSNAKRKPRLGHSAGLSKV